MIALTKKQIESVVHAIGNWLEDEEILKQNFDDDGKSLWEADKILRRELRLRNERRNR